MTVVSTRTVYSCATCYCITFHMNNCEPDFAPPCISKPKQLSSPPTSEFHCTDIKKPEAQKTQNPEQKEGSWLPRHGGSQSDWRRAPAGGSHPGLLECSEWVLSLQQSLCTVLPARSGPVSLKKEAGQPAHPHALETSLMRT